MKYASTLTLAAYLYSGETVNASYTWFESCPDEMPYMKDFDLTQYTGTWY
jgi:lipocalin